MQRSDTISALEYHPAGLLGERCQHARRLSAIGSAVLLIAIPSRAGHSRFTMRLLVRRRFYIITAAEGAGDHVETMSRSLLDRRAFDWLDGIFKA